MKQLPTAPVDCTCGEWSNFALVLRQTRAFSSCGCLISNIYFSMAFFLILIFHETYTRTNTDMHRHTHQSERQNYTHIYISINIYKTVTWIHEQLWKRKIFHFEQSIDKTYLQVQIHNKNNVNWSHFPTFIPTLRGNHTPEIHVINQSLRQASLFSSFITQRLQINTLLKVRTSTTQTLRIINSLFQIPSQRPRWT